MRSSGKSRVATMVGSMMLVGVLGVGVATPVLAAEKTTSTTTPAKSKSPAKKCVITWYRWWC
jgi:hypothetical protein